MKLMLMIYVFLLISVLLTGCGSDGSNGRPGADAEPCMVEQLDDGVYISCPESDVFIPSDESDETVECRRGNGHAKHNHTKHEECE